MKGASRSSLFLMEMMLAILFFSICAAVCVRVFAYSAELGEHAARVEDAVLLAEDAAAVFKAENGDLQSAAALLGGETVFYDENCAVTDSGSAVYTLEIKSVESDYASAAEITVSDDAPLYTLTVKSAGGEGK